MSEDYFKEALDLSENKEVPLWDPNFVTHVCKNPNQMSKLSKTQLSKINNTAIARGRHPDGIICSVRWREKLQKWQGKTNGRKIVNLTNDWFDLNVAWQFTDFYNRTLKPLKDNKRAKKGTRPRQIDKWIKLLIGAQTGETKLPVHIECNVNHEIKFKYLQKDYGDVCVLINGINVCCVMECNHLVEKISPYLEKKALVKIL